VRRDAKNVERMKKETAKTFRAFLIELAIYAVLVVAYFFLVLHFLGESLHQLETRHRYTYGGVAILLIIGQAVVLESVTTLLLRMLRGRSE
jgi:hypothetical protein